jgi:hypothetical protein
MRSSATATRLDDDSIWRTWKPYAGIAAALAGAMWWYTNQSSFATLKNGDYACQAVFVAQDGKYQLGVDEAGNRYPGASATVRGGEVVRLAAETEMPAEQVAAMAVLNKGTSHFLITDDPAPHSYWAFACDHVGGSAL